MITPTVGRVVHLRRISDARDAQPNCAFIAFVHDDRLINIAWLDADGNFRRAQRVQLRHGDDGDDQKAEHWCEWMPYQKGQAAKTGAAEKAAKQVAK